MCEMVWIVDMVSQRHVSSILVSIWYCLDCAFTFFGLSFCRRHVALRLYEINRSDGHHSRAIWSDVTDVLDRTQQFRDADRGVLWLPRFFFTCQRHLYSVGVVTNEHHARSTSHLRSGLVSVSSSMMQVSCSIFGKKVAIHVPLMSILFEVS